MSNISFCNASLNEYGCYVSLPLTYLPVLCFIFLARKAYNDLKFETLDLDLPTITWIHLIKMTINLCLISSALIMTIGFINNPYISIGFIFSSGMTFICYCITLFILRKEYKKFGYTSQYLITFWGISIFFHIIGSIFFFIQDDMVDDNMLLEYGFIIYFVLELILTIFTWIFTKDSSKAIDVDDIANQYIAIKDRKIKESFISPQKIQDDIPILKESKSSINENDIRDKFNLYAKKKEDFNYHKLSDSKLSSSPSKIDENSPSDYQTNNNSINNSSKNDNKSLTGSFEITEEISERYNNNNNNNQQQQQNNRQHSIINNQSPKKGLLSFLDSKGKKRVVDIYDIIITHWEEIDRGYRKTIGYVIKYNIEGIPVVTIRSYSEFYKIFQKMSKVATIPEFPKLPKTEYEMLQNDENILLQRKTIFNQFLRTLIEKKAITKDLLEFLSPIEEIPLYNPMDKYSDQNTPTILSHRSTKHPTETYSLANLPSYNHNYNHQSIVQYDDSNIINKANEYRNVLKSKTLSFDQCMNTLERKTQYRMPTKSEINPRREKYITQNIIEDYTNKLNNATTPQEKYHYSIDISNYMFIGTDDINTYYEISICNENSLVCHTVKRRYKEFRKLQDELIIYSKKNGYDIPELPNRGNIGALIYKNDIKLIEYRKFALKNYLQGIISSTKYFKCQALLNFLDLNINLE